MSIRIASVTVGPLLLLLSGCHGMYLHNADRNAVAAVAKKNVESVDVPSITKTEHDNLAKVLAEEIKSIEARQKLVATLATVQLAANEQSVASQYRNAKIKMKLALGTDSVLDLVNVSQCRINREESRDQLRNVAGMLTALGAKNVPGCAEAASKGIEKPAGLSGDDSADFDKNKGEYLKQCQMAEAVCGGIATREAAQLASTRADLDKLHASEKAIEKQLKDAKQAYQEALNQNKKKAGTHTPDEIKKLAQDVIDTASKASKLSPTLANKVKGSALIELLTAAAGGKTDSTDPELAPALVAAKEFPALAGSIEQAVQARAMVPVSHLLLTLNDLTIQAGRDAALRELYEEEIAHAEQKVEMRHKQARLWRRYSDQLCNLAYLAALDEYPRSSCEITFPEKLPEANAPLTCTIQSEYAQGEKPAGATTNLKTTPIKDCILTRPWHTLLTDKLYRRKAGSEKSEDPRQKRAVYEAAAAYLHVRLTAYQTSAEEFRRIDVLHRRTVVQREAALLQWKNLVAVPADELNGYYAGGVKPSELADLIVKAVGFAAIAIGVAQ